MTAPTTALTAVHSGHFVEVIDDGEGTWHVAIHATDSPHSEVIHTCGVDQDDYADGELPVALLVEIIDGLEG